MDMWFILIIILHYSKKEAPFREEGQEHGYVVYGDRRLRVQYTTSAPKEAEGQGAVSKFS